VQEPQPHPQTTTRREALQALAEGYAHRLGQHLARPDGTDLGVSFAEISPGILEQAFRAWQGSHPGAGLAPPQQGRETPSLDRPEVPSRTRASRGIYLYDFSRPADLEMLADTLLRGEGRLNGPDHLAAAAVLAERARREDQLSRATRTTAAVIEQRVAGLLERADRPDDALRMYKAALQGFEADPHQERSAKSCQVSIDRLNARSHEKWRVAKARWSSHAANALAAEQARATREAVAFFQDDRSVDGVRRPGFQSTTELFEELGQHLRAGGYAKAELVAQEIDDRMRGREPDFLSILNQTTLAELREQRGAALAAEPLRESVYQSSVRMYGHGDPRTIEAARDYVENLRSEDNLGTPETFARASDFAQRALRNAELGRVGEVLRYRVSRGRTAPPVSKELFDAAKASLEASARHAGQDRRRTADHEQAPPQLYSNPQRGLRGAVGKARHGGARRGVAGRNATAKDPNARRAGR
jgi:hypothetical protein